MAYSFMPTACQRLLRGNTAQVVFGNSVIRVVFSARPVPWSRKAPAVRAMTLVPPRRLEVLADITLRHDHLVGRRLDEVLSELFPSRYSTASGAKKAIRRKEIHVNGAVGRTDLVVSQGDVVQVVVKVGNAAAWPSAKGKPGLEVAFEDEYMACVIKPQGLPTQGKGENTVQGRVKYCLQPSPLPGALFRPHHVHRLDVNTGGLLLVAKTRQAATILARDLADHAMQKRYLALVLGRLEGSGVIDFPLDGKPAITLLRAEAHSTSSSFGCLTCVSLWPKTGRTHQLRKHCAYMGHPILGDLQYRHHRKAECTARPVEDLQQYLPHMHYSDSQVTAAAGAPCGEGAVQQQQQQQQHKRQKQHHADLTSQPAAAGIACHKAAALPDNLQGVPWQTQHSSAPSDEASSSAATEDLTVSLSSAERTVGVGNHAAAAAASGTCRQQQQQLADGSSVATCLWAVELQLLHPVTKRPLNLNIEERAVRLYQKICNAEALPAYAADEQAGSPPAAATLLAD